MRRRVPRADTAPAGAVGQRAVAGAPRPRTRRPTHPDDVIDLQKSVGNQAVVGLVRPAPPSADQVQRVGGWSDATSAKASGLDKGDPHQDASWNAAEHAVGSIRRIPIDGLVGGLQKALGKDDGGKGLTTEQVGGTVSGPARSEAAEQAGRGRAIALVPTGIRTDRPVDVLFHLHGNTENSSRGYAGWRQHSTSGQVRDVERDRIAQQIEASGSGQLVGILPMGVNASQFGSINPDAYIRDAFDRLAEVGAWKTAPPTFRVVLSAHSGGGFTVQNILGDKKKQPANLGMIVLFEANNSTKYKNSDGETVQIAARNQAFLSWAMDQLNGHLRFVKDPAHTDKEKIDRLATAPRLRAFFSTNGSYATQYKTMRSTVADWLKTNAAALGTYLPAMTELIQVIEQGGNHENQMKQGLGTALGALPGAGSGTGTGVPSVPSSTKLRTTGQTTPTGQAGGSGAAIGALGQVVGGVIDAVLAGQPADTFAAREERISADRVAAAATGSGGASILAMVGYAAALAAGRSPLSAAATGFVTSGITSATDVTDALFALMRPELGGGRIPAGRSDLSKEWLDLRAGYARPALGGGARTSKAKGGGPGGNGAAGVPTAPAKAVEPDPGAVKEVPAVEPPTTTPTGPALTPEQEYETFNADVKAAFKKEGVKRYLAVRPLYAKRSMTKGNPADWLNQLQFGTAFAGTKLNGVHPKLMSALSSVDKEITRLIAAMPPGTPVVFQGDFQPRPVTGKPDKLSDHALGLALHLNYKNNPYIGRNAAASALVARIAQEAGVGGDNFWKSMRGSGKDTSQDRVEELYRDWASTSDAVAAYFREMEAMEVKKKAGTLPADLQGELATRQAEYKKLRYSDLSGHRDPKNGVFMHTAHADGDPMLQLIKQLTGPAGLEWGGTYTSQPKDLHHFALKL